MVETPKNLMPETLVIRSLDDLPGIIEEEKSR